MSLKPGVLNPSKNDKHDMFVGWDKVPVVDRRFLFGALPLALLGTSGASYAIAKNVSDPGAGARLTTAPHSVTGVLVHAPYPMIRVADAASVYGLRSMLIIAQGKCNTGYDFSETQGHAVKADGVIVQRKNRQLLEVPPFVGDWISDSQDLPADQISTLSSPTEESLGRAQLAGTIMDTKCFFGVMRPGRGKTHKACASLCIRGGIPPSFWARTKDGRETVLLMTDAEGGPVPLDILPLVADPVTAEGEIIRVGDLLQFRADVNAYRRI